jgi:hypothetical protein
MRVLVAGRNAEALATTAGAFAHDLIIETAATKAECLALLERTEFDLIVACETLNDGSGLEVLSHAAVNTPDTLRIFAAKPSTLNHLQGELGVFGLFRVLPYPINFRKLWAALNLARSCCAKAEPQTQAPPDVRHVVLEDELSGGEAAGQPQDAVGEVQEAPVGEVLEEPVVTHVLRPSARARAQLAAEAKVARTGAAANGRTAASGFSAGTHSRMRAASGVGAAVARAGTAVNNGAAAHAGSRAQQIEAAQQVARAARAGARTAAHVGARIAPQHALSAGPTAGDTGTAANNRTAATSIGAATTQGAAMNTGAPAQRRNPSQRVQARLAAMVSAGAVAQPAVRPTTPGSEMVARAAAAAAARPGATVNVSSAAHGSDTGARAATAATARTGAVVNGRRVAHGGDTDARAAATAAARTGTVVNGGGATHGGDTDARAAATAAARTGAVVNGGRAAQGAAPSRQRQPRQDAQARATPTAAAQRPAHVVTAGIPAAANSDTFAVGTPAAANSDTFAMDPSAATARTGSTANNGGTGHAASPPRKAQPRQAQPQPVQPGRAQLQQAQPQPVQPGRAQLQQAQPQPVQPRRAQPQQAQPQPVQPRQAQPRQAQPRQVAAPQSSPRTQTATARRNTQIPQNEAFKRAVAKRNASKLEANSDMSPVDVLGTDRQSRGTGQRGERRREPAMSNDSLAQLARLTTIRRPTYDSRSVPGARKRAAIFVGSGVFAAATAAVLTFFMLSENNSMGRSSLPLVASIQHPVPQKVFPWQPAPQQAANLVPIRSESSATAAADLEVQAEAASDASEVEPGHPGPPPPNPPPPPAEPPSLQAPPGWVDE